MADNVHRRATTDEEKREVIEQLYKLWVQNHDLRLGQLIGNVFETPYMLEDYDFVRILEEYYSLMGEA